MKLESPRKDTWTKWARPIDCSLGPTARMEYNYYIPWSLFGKLRIQLPCAYILPLALYVLRFPPPPTGFVGPLSHGTRMSRAPGTARPSRSTILSTLPMLNLQTLIHFCLVALVSAQSKSRNAPAVDVLHVSITVKRCILSSGWLNICLVTKS